MPTIVLPLINSVPGVFAPQSVGQTQTGVDLRLYFGAEDRTFLLRARSVTINRAVNTRWAAELALFDSTEDGDYRPAPGQPFTIDENGTRMFSGYIDEVEESDERALDANNRFYRCSCSSWAAKLDHLYVFQKYPPGSYVYAVINDIFENYADGEGFTQNHVGLNLTSPADEMDFVGKSIAECLDRLRDLSGWQWYVDEFQDVHHEYVGFGPTASFDIVENDCIAGSIKVKTTTRNFRNVQYLRCSVNVIAGTRVETFAGDGSTFFFPSEWPIKTVPVVTVNGVEQDMFEIDVDPYGQPGYYWGPLFSGVQQGEQIPPAPGDEIIVSYGSFQSNIISTKDDASIAARAAIEGPSGRWEQIDQITGTITEDLAIQFCQGLLVRSGIIPQVVSLQSDRPGLKVGEKVTITVPRHNLTGSYTIQSINSIAIEPNVDLGYGSQFRHSITASNANDIGGYVHFMEELVRRFHTGPTDTTPDQPDFDADVTEPAVVNIKTIDVTPEKVSAIRGINTTMFAFDETDPELQGSGTIDASEFEFSPTFNGSSRKGITFAVGDYFFWNDPGAYEICRIIDLGATSPPGPWIVKRGQIGSTRSAHTDCTFYRLELHKKTESLQQLGIGTDLNAAKIPKFLPYTLQNQCVLAITMELVGASDLGPIRTKNYSPGPLDSPLTMEVPQSPGLRTNNGAMYQISKGGPCVAGDHADYRTSITSPASVRCVYAYTGENVGDSPPVDLVVWPVVISANGTVVGWLDEITIAAGERLSYPVANLPRDRGMPYDTAWEPSVFGVEEFPRNILPTFDNALDVNGNLDPAMTLGSPPGYMVMEQNCFIDFLIVSGTCETLTLCVET